MIDPILAARLIRREWSRVVSTAMRIVGDLDVAEDVAQEALLVATERWPVDGVPRNPGAWLTTVARNRALNHLRTQKRRADADLDVLPAPDEEPDLDAYPDERLALMTLCCHPSLSTTSQVALTLRLAGGLTTREIARAYVTPEATIGQRISRAKATLRAQGAKFELPPPRELPDRLAPVLEAIYLVFNEGYSPPIREALMESAQVLAQVLTEVAPTRPEPWGLAALMWFKRARFAARVDATGRLVPLDEQERSRWDRDAIARGEQCRAAGQAAARAGDLPVGAHMLQAEIDATHCRAEAWDDTDWPSIDRLYAALVATNNPVVALNHAVARSYASGPEAGLDMLAPLLTDPRLANYHFVQAAQADMLHRAGRRDDAAALYRALLARVDDPSEQAHYRRRLELL